MNTMDNLLSNLRELRRVAPQGDYAASSRREILASRVPVTRRISVTSLFRGAGAFAMASLALIGGISLVRSATPAADRVALESIAAQQAALSAEAETIETQLALADVQYQAVADAPDTSRSVTPAALSVARSAAGGSGDTAVDMALAALTD